ncbi:MAG TPA: hypothetical protein VHL08_06770 [Dongiaceae bacterium]|nr:hypothetical protein [Dongiaceae bacterium]
MPPNSDGNDRLDGRNGNDTLTGGKDSDTFVVSHGQDVVTDFLHGTDHIEISNGVFGVPDFAHLSISQSGGDTLLTFGLDTVRLSNVLSSSLTSGDFVFVA